jgi:hypothetical protein
LGNLQFGCGNPARRLSVDRNSTVQCEAYRSIIYQLGVMSDMTINNSGIVNEDFFLFKKNLYIKKKKC